MFGRVFESNSRIRGRGRNVRGGVCSQRGVGGVEATSTNHFVYGVTDANHLVKHTMTDT